MGLPMRYPRFLVVLFAALGLAASPAVSARAADAPAVPEALLHVDTLTEIAAQTAVASDLARLGGVVIVLADEVNVGHDEAHRLVDAFATMLIAVAGAGERTGVLAIPETDLLIDVILRAAATNDPDAAQAYAKAVYLGERSAEASDFIGDAERAVVDALAGAVGGADADPVTRWRPLVEEYFPRDLVDQALAIIECESNGDPAARNPRSSATGLFQFLSRTWENASGPAGFEGASPLDPEANVAAAAWLVDYSLDAGHSAWKHWTCRP
ncbi:MAG: transglycosylase SLT domain-containing protein [Acidimicrobiia bacterium]